MPLNIVAAKVSNKHFISDAGIVAARIRNFYTVDDDLIVYGKYFQITKDPLWNFGKNFARVDKRFVDRFVSIRNL